VRKKSPIIPSKEPYPLVRNDLLTLAWLSIANTAEPPPEGTPANKASLFRKCDAGVVFSEMTNLADISLSFFGEDSPRYLQRMIVKAPQVSLASGEVSLEVNALVEVLGQRSFAEPDVNCTISFRQTCSDFAPNMGRLYCPFYQAAAVMKGLMPRSVFEVVSWPMCSCLGFLVWTPGVQWRTMTRCPGSAHDPTRLS